MASLPTELLDKIFSHIREAGFQYFLKGYESPQHRSPDLARCAAVCRKWNLVATRILWRVSETWLSFEHSKDTFSYYQPYECTYIRQPNLLWSAMAGHSLERLQFLANEIEVMRFGHGYKWESDFIALPQSENGALKELVSKFSKLEFPKLKTLSLSRTGLVRIVRAHDLVRNLLTAPRLVDLDPCSSSLHEQMYRQVIKYCKHLHCFRMNSVWHPLPIGTQLSLKNQDKKQLEELLRVLSSFHQLREFEISSGYRNLPKAKKAIFMKTLADHRGLTRILGLELGELVDPNVYQETSKTLLSHLDTLDCKRYHYPLEVRPQDWLPFATKLEHMSLTIHETAMDWLSKSIKLAQLRTLELELELNIYRVGPQVLYDILGGMSNLKKLRIFHCSRVGWVLPGWQMTPDAVLPIMDYIQSPGNFPELKIFDEDFSNPPQVFVRWDRRGRRREDVVWPDTTRWRRAGSIWSSESICRSAFWTWQKEMLPPLE